MSREADCIFCKIVAGDIPASVVYEDESILAFLDIGPLAEGHLLVIPRGHTSKLSELPMAESAKLGAALPALARALLEVTGAEGFNLLVNEGRTADSWSHTFTFMLSHVGATTSWDTAGTPVRTRPDGSKSSPSPTRTCSPRIGTDLRAMSKVFHRAAWMVRGGQAVVASQPVETDEFFAGYLRLGRVACPRQPIPRSPARRSCAFWHAYRNQAARFAARCPAAFGYQRWVRSGSDPAETL